MGLYKCVSYNESLVLNNVVFYISFSTIKHINICLTGRNLIMERTVGISSTNRITALFKALKLGHQKMFNITDFNDV